jgi:hypothetical protein
MTLAPRQRCLWVSAVMAWNAPNVAAVGGEGQGGETLLPLQRPDAVGDLRCRLAGVAATSSSPFLNCRVREMIFITCIS